MAYLTLQFKSQELNRSVTIRAFLPTDSITGESVSKPYRTVYFLPGYSADALEVMSYIGFRRECELKGLAIVFVDHCNSFYVDHPERNENFSAFVGRELVEVTRRILPLSPRREDTYIAGISAGGYGALYNGLKYHSVFSKVAAMSPSVDCYDLLTEHPEVGFRKEIFTAMFGSEEEYLTSEMNIAKAYSEADKAIIPEVFLGCGTGDSLVWNAVERFETTLNESEVRHLFYPISGDHDLDCWERMSDAVFSFLAGIEPGTKNKLTIGNFG